MSVPDNSIRDTAHQCPPQSALPPAAHHYQPCPYLLCHLDYLHFGSPFSEVGLLNSPPRLLYTLYLLLEHLLGRASVLPEHIFEVGRRGGGRDWHTSSHGAHVQLGGGPLSEIRCGSGSQLGLLRTVGGQKDGGRKDAHRFYCPPCFMRSGFLAKSRLRLVGEFAGVPSLKNSGLGFKEGGIKPRPEGSVFTTLSINLVVIGRL